MTVAPFRVTLMAVLPLALVACGGAATDRNLSTLDDELAEGTNATDPLLAAAVNDPIMTDPQLSTRSNADAIRPPSQPYAAPVPAADIAGATESDDGALMTMPEPTPGPCRQCAIARDAITLGALAARQPDPATRSCAASLRYAAGWANRLPAGMPLYRGAQVIEAAGTDAAGCRLRAVTFTVNRQVAHMLDWHFTQATKAGYRINHQADDALHVLAGSRRDGAAYVAVLRETDGGGSEVDLLVNDRR